VWVGTTDDLARLVRACRELELSRHTALRATHSATEVNRKTEWLGRWSYLSAEEKEEHWAKSNDGHLANEISEATLRMEVVSRSYEERLYGNPDEILLELERPKDVKSFEIVLGTQSYSSHTSQGTGFRLVADSDGASVTVFGYDKDWVDLTTSRLKKILREQRPWYFWMAKFWFALLLTTVVCIGWESLFVWIFGGVSSGGWLAFIIPASITAVLSGFFWDRILPKFELFRPDRRARGSRQIGVTATGALWVVGTIVIPLLMK
jgi:hypothetical protein